MATHEETQKDIVEQVESDTDEEDEPMEVNARKKKKKTAKNKPDQAFDIENEEEPRRSTRFSF